GMSLRDLHTPLYLAVGDPGLSRAAHPGEQVDVPLYASFLSGSRAIGDSLVIRADLTGWNSFGEQRRYPTVVRRIAYRPWMSAPLAPLTITMPNEPAVAVLAVRLEDASGTVLHRNFTTFVVEGNTPPTGTLTDGRRVR